MIRFYRIAVCIGASYDLVDYCLDPSQAAARALRAARKVDPEDYVLVSQIDVYPAKSEVHEFLRVDGTQAVHGSKNLYGKK